MKITDLINILNEHLEAYGDRDVLFLEENSIYHITYLGSGSSHFGDYFWLTCDVEFPHSDDPGQFKAPGYKPTLKCVK